MSGERMSGERMSGERMSGERMSGKFNTQRILSFQRTMTIGQQDASLK